MAQQQTATPFAEEQQQDAAANKDQQLPDATTIEAVVDPGQPNGYKIVRTATGKNYVEADDYDPLEHHRSRDPSANKGQGLGFMFCCCGRPQTEEADTVQQ